VAGAQKIVVRRVIFDLFNNMGAERRMFFHFLGFFGCTRRFF
jgi:hypothetical protein